MNADTTNSAIVTSANTAMTATAMANAASMNKPSLIKGNMTNVKGGSGGEDTPKASAISGLLVRNPAEMEKVRVAVLSLCHRVVIDVIV